MALCDGISASITQNCDTPPIAGTADILYLINRSDIDVFTLDTTGIGPQAIVTNLTLLSGKAAYMVEGRNNSNVAGYELVKGTYFDSYQHNVSFVAFDNSPAVKAQIEKMVQRGDLIAIVENNFRGATGNAAFELYGYTSGLEVLTATRNTGDADSQASHMIALGSPDLSKEPHLPYSVFDTSYATTKALLQGLL